MFMRHIATALCAVNVASGLKDASPFFLLSTEPLRGVSVQSSQISTAASVQERVLDGLADCSASLYILIQQPGITTHDLRDGSTMPNMRNRIQNEDYRGTVRIAEVMGGLDMENMAVQLSRNCGFELKDLTNYCKPYGDESELGNDGCLLTKHEFKVSGDERPGNVVLTVSEASLTNSKDTTRESMLQLHDAVLEHRLSSILANRTSHVLIYISTPPSAAKDEGDGPPHHTYEMDESLLDTAMHLDLKRDVGRIHSRQSGDPQAGLPLFEKYQFLSPAIFMGLGVALLLLVILNVGISAISGLEISYMAFSKEMGPQSQQKGKQQ